MAKKVVGVCFQSDDGDYTCNITVTPHSTCNHCPFASTSKARIIAHIWDAHEVSHQCYLCHAGLQSWKELLEHVRLRHLPMNAKLFICKECDATRSSFELFVLHHMKHFQRIKRNRRKSNYAKRMTSRMQNDGRKSSTTLSKILRKDTDGIAEYPVVQSSQFQNNAPALSKDLFRCHLCSYTTKSSCSLDDHIRRHLNVREFACDLCSKAFISKGELTRHRNCRHPNSSTRKHQCPHCWFYSWRKDVIAAHTRSHHPEVVQMKTTPRGRNFKVPRLESFHYEAPPESAFEGSVLRSILTSDSS